MAEVRTKSPPINVTVGDTFDVTLQSMAGSTGYSWYLREMPRCVVLVAIKTEPVHGPGTIGPSRHIFTFIAMSPCEAEIDFALLALWHPQDVADIRAYPLKISEKKTTELESDIAGKFAGTGPHVVHQPAIPPYGFPTSVIESSERCVLMYGFPGGIATDPQHCTLKYGFPIHHGPIRPLYGFPPPNVIYGTAFGSAANEAMRQPYDKSCVIPLYGYPYPLPMEVTEDSSHCVVKYGFPHGIATDEENCTLKYGYPVLKYGFPTCENK